MRNDVVDFWNAMDGLFHFGKCYGNVRPPNLGRWIDARWRRLEENCILTGHSSSDIKCGFLHRCKKPHGISHWLKKPRGISHLGRGFLHWCKNTRGISHCFNLETTIRALHPYALLVYLANWVTCNYRFSSDKWIPVLAGRAIVVLAGRAAFYARVYAIVQNRCDNND